MADPDSDPMDVCESLDEDFIGELETSIRRSINLSKLSLTDPSPLHPSPLLNHKGSVEISPADATNRTTLTAWMISKADILPALSAQYATLFVSHGLGSIKRLAKKIKKSPDFLISVGVHHSDADLILAALRNEKLLEMPIFGTKSERSSSKRTTKGSSSDTERTGKTSSPSSSRILSAGDLPVKVKVSVEEISKKLQQVIDSEDSLTVEELAKEACRDIISAAGESAEMQAALGTAGICEDIVSLITIYTPSSARVLQNAFCALCTLCRRHSDDKTTQCMENIRRLGQMRACQATITALRRYPDTLLVVKWTAIAVRNLCSLDANRAFFGTSGACHALMQTARAYETNEDVLRWMFRAMGNLANGNNENRMSLVHHGLCEFLISAMERYDSHPLVLADSCWALRSLAVGDQSCRSRLVQLRSCEIVSRTLKDHFSTDFVVTEACRALLALAADSEDTVQRIGANGSCASITIPLLGTANFVDGLVVHPSQTTCCGEQATVACLSAICSLAVTDTMRGLFFEVGACESIVSAFTHHVRSSDVAIWGCKAILKLSSSSVAPKKMRRAGVCQCLVELLGREIVNRDAEVAEWAGLCVSVLAIDKINREALANEGVCQVVVNSLMQHQSNPDVAYRVCGAVHFLAIDDSIREELGKAGACEVVSCVLQLHTGTARSLASLEGLHEGAVQASARALGSLACESPVNCARLFEAGACNALMEAFITFRHSAAMMEFCCRACARMCREDRCTSLLGANGACECVIYALEEYNSREAVVKHGMLAVSAMTETESEVISVREVCDENIRRFLVVERSIGVIIKALEMHAEINEVIATCGCRALGRLYDAEAVGQNKRSAEESEAHRQGIAEACKVVVTCIGAHSVNQEVQIEGIRTVSIIAHSSKENNAILGDLGYIGVLVTTLMQHKEDSRIVSACFESLVSLVVPDDKCKLLCDAKGCEAVVNAFKTLVSNVAVARCGCELLRIMARCDGTRRMLGVFHICDVLISAVETHSAPEGDMSVVVPALKALGSMCVLDSNTAALSSSSKAISMLCVLLQERKDDLEIIEWACRVVLILLAYVPQIPESELEQQQVKSSRSTGTLPPLSDEPTTNIGSSSPRRVYHGHSLASVSPDHSPCSLSPVCGDKSCAYVTYHPNTESFLESQLHVILGELLSHHRNNETLAWLVLEGLALLTMSENGAESVVSEEEVDFCALVCTALQIHLEQSEKTELAACKVIANISGFSDYSILMGNAGACGLVVPFVKRYYDESPDCVTIGFTAMAYLCKRNASNKIALAASGACEVAFTCLQKYAFLPDVVGHVLHAIKCLCSQNKFNTTKLTAAGTLDFIIQHMIETEILGADPSLLGTSLWCIGHLPPASLSILAAPTVTTFVMRSLSSHSVAGGNPYVVLCACDAIYALCLYVTDSRRRIADMMGCDKLITVLVQFEKDENVLHSALMAIANLVDRTPDNQSRVKASFVLKTMQVRCDSVVVVRGALAALLGLVHDNPSHPSKLNTVSAVKIILKGIFLHKACEIVAKRGSSLLALLAAHDKSYQKTLGSEGACNIVVEVMKVHDSNVVVLREACWALCSLSHKFDSNRTKIIQIGGIELLTGILKRHSGSEPVVLWACGTLANIAATKTGSNSPQFMEAGTGVMVVEILQMYGLGGTEGSEPVLRYVCWAVGNLATVPVLCASLGEAGACEGITLVLMKHVASAAAAQLACTAIFHLAKLPENKKRLEDAGAVAVVDMCLQQHATNDIVMKWAKKAKSVLANTRAFHSFSFSKGDLRVSEEKSNSEGSVSGDERDGDNDNA
mmetsp:Transcript_14322/g.21446  ORF Transcript_14322/g.21446 Transcript_14322/m.21446 type:complete len:1805 (-) Transcript_14322:136-5550(-)